MHGTLVISCLTWKPKLAREHYVSCSIGYKWNASRLLNGHFRWSESWFSLCWRLRMRRKRSAEQQQAAAAKAAKTSRPGIPGSAIEVPWDCLDFGCNCWELINLCTIHCSICKQVWAKESINLLCMSSISAGIVLQGFCSLGSTEC